MPPALPRPPAGICAFTMHGPIRSAAAKASSAEVATSPAGILSPARRSRGFAMYSQKSGTASLPSHLPHSLQ